VEVLTDRDAEILSYGTLITQSSIVALRERFRKQGRKVEHGVTLREAMRRNGDPGDWVAVFAKMLSGGIQFEFTDRFDASLSDALLVRCPDISRHVSRRCTGPGISGITISCQAAAKILGTTSGVVLGAVKIGLIPGEAQGRRRGTVFALSLEYVLAFQKDMIVGEELRQAIGGHQTSICRQLDRAGINPAMRIHNSKVWRRSDIERYMEHQSNADRAAP
jgi:hypothetical protein